MAKIVQVARYTADGTQVTREFQKMGEAGEKMSQRVTQGARGMSASLRAVDAAGGVAKEKMEGLAGSAGSVGTVLRSLGPVGLVAAAGIGAAALALKALHDNARAAVRVLGDIHDTAQALGVSTGTLQEWRFAVLGTGESAEVADEALQRFNTTLGQLNTELGRRARGALEELGFSDEEIERLHTVENALPQIADRLLEIDNAASRAAIGQKLGITELLPALADGSQGLAEMAAEARRLGYVLDAELLARADELNGAWTQAEQIINLQLKAALVDLAPVFVDLSRDIAAATVALVSFLDAGKALGLQAQSTIRDRIGDAGAEQFDLIRRFGEGVTRGGDASRGGRTGPLGLIEGTMRDRFAFLQAQVDRDLAELTRRERDAAAAAAAGGGGGGGGSPDPAGGASEHQRFVEQLREELRVRDELLAIQAESPKLTQQEAEAQFALAEQLRQLAEARAAGAIASDEDLAALQRSVEANHEAAAAARANAEAMELRNAQAAAWRALMISLETPRERMLREEADFRKLWAGQEGTETFARGIARIREEYEALAEAQFEASLAGQTLAGIIDGQIRSFEDLALVLGDMSRDALVAELLSGSLFREGVGSFVSGAGDRFANSVTGGSEGLAGIAGLFGGEEDPVAALGKSAKAAASGLSDALTPSVAEATVKMVAGTTATVTETSAKTVGSGSMAKLALAADAAAAALAKIAAAEQGEDIANAFAAFAGGSGGGRAGGGSTLVGARHGVSELGPELAVVGGWGQVVPNQALEGLALLAKLSQGAVAQPARSGPARVNVNLRNESGVEMEASAEARTASDGGIDIDLVLGRTVAAQIGRGTADDAMRSRFNVRPQRVRRG